MKYRLVIFDFDGTLADSFPFFLKVFNQLAAQHHFKPIEPDLVGSLRHYNTRQMMQYVGLPAWKMPLVAKNFIAMMKQNADSIPLFHGVQPMLEQLSAAGIALAVVSSNSYENIIRILSPDIAPLFRQYECGMSVFGKASRIRSVVKRSGIAPEESLYIGDLAADGEAAHAVSVAFGAVLWGYGTAESLQAEGPELLFRTMDDIAGIVDDGKRFNE
jgi:phosphoglycolate phosphatase